ncbi:MAG: dihydrofolate reductase [Pirellulales bacterium]
MTARVSIIVAVADNGVIGRQGTLPWRLSSDLQRFKKLTWGSPLIMGRRTYDSIGKPLPGRTSIVLTHRPLASAPSLLTATSLDEALGLVGSATEVFVIGGHALFAAALPRADRLYWTAVHAAVDGDVSFPEVDWSQWQLTEQTDLPADDRNDYPTTYQVYDRAPLG